MDKLKMKTLPCIIALLLSAPAFAQQTGGADNTSGADNATKPPGVRSFSVYNRPIHLTYALRGGKVLKQSDGEILAAIDSVPGRVTSVNPFLLNSADPSKHEAILNALKARGIAVFIGVGRLPGHEGWSIDSKNMRDLAKACVAYSDSIRVDNLQGYYDREGREPIQSYIDYLRSIGFKHIMLNPWPVSKGAAVPFTGAESTIIEITLSKFDRKTGQVFPASTNWEAKERRIAMMRAYDPSVKILVNYESEPQHRALAWLESRKAGSSKAALDVAAKQCEHNGWYWCPPWTKIYDPLALGTWKWISARLGTMNANTAPGPASNPGLMDGTDATGRGRLAWLGGAQRTSSEVYFGTTPAPPLAVTQKETAFDPGPLRRNTTYYWKITEVNQYGKTDGPVWSFTTK
jgi:hypothetical protein